MKKQQLPDLPYPYDALEPAISERIMRLHHDKHHAGYVKKTNAAIEKLQSAQESGSSTAGSSDDLASKQEVANFNYKHVLRDLSFNLNGHLLHSVFWQNMSPFQQDNQPEQQLIDRLSSQFGSLENFKKAFTQTAVSVEGSGWGALLKNQLGQLQLMQIENHNKLYLTEFELVLVVDVWEHAYYLDWENNRGQYLENWWRVVNWSDVAQRLG